MNAADRSVISVSTYPGQMALTVTPFAATSAATARAWASDNAMARPIPRPPPVMSATRPVSSANSGLAQDLRQFGQIDIPAGDDAGDPSLAGLAGERHRQGNRAGTLGDHAIALGHQAQRRGDLLEAGGEGSIQQLLCEFEHVLKDRLTPDPIDERWLVIDGLWRTRLQRRRKWRAGVGLHRKDANGRLERPQRRRDPAGQPAAAPRNH